MFILALDYGTHSSARFDLTECPHGNGMGNIQWVSYPKPHEKNFPEEYHEGHPNFIKEKDGPANWQYFKNQLMLPISHTTDISTRETCLSLGILPPTDINTLQRSICSLATVTFT